MNEGNPWRPVEHDGQLERELAPFDFYEAFIVEASVVVASGLSPPSEGAGSDERGDLPIWNYGAAGDLRLVILSPDSPEHGLEIHLHQAESVRLPLDSELRVTAEVRRTQVFLWLAEGDQWRMEGTALRWRFLPWNESQSAGRYGRPLPEDLSDDPHLWEPRVNWRDEPP